jgi:hypothetical protein
MINPQWGFNPIIIRMLFAVTLFQQRVMKVHKGLTRKGYFHFIRVVSI